MSFDGRWVFNSKINKVKTSVTDKKLTKFFGEKCRTKHLIKKLDVLIFFWKCIVLSGSLSLVKYPVYISSFHDYTLTIEGAYAASERNWREIKA
jgi:hypothetical protein